MPELRNPTLVCAFAGWNDAAGAASTALGRSRAAWSPRSSPASTPRSSTTSRSTARRSAWWTAAPGTWTGPQNTFVAAPIPGADKDFILMTGVEPNLRWRSYSTAILDVAERMGAKMLISLGALIADVAHTLPVPITGLASEESLVEELGLSRSNYEGPTGIVGVLHDQARQRNMPSASLWAAVPHYVAAVPEPEGGACAPSPPRGAHRRRARGIRARGRDGALRGPGEPGRLRPTPRSRSWSAASSPSRTTRSSYPRSPQATPWPATSSAF